MGDTHNELSTACHWCDYDLSGTDDEGLCPECGVPVTYSKGLGAIEHVPMEELTALRGGMRTVTNGILLLIVAFIPAYIYLINALGQVTNGFIEPEDAYVPMVVFSLVTCVFPLIILYGWWRIAKPFTGIPGTIDASPSRKFLNATLIIAAALYTIALVLSFVPMNLDPYVVEPIDIVNSIVSILIFLANLVSYIAQLLYFRWVAKLTRTHKMERRAKHLVWSGPVIAVFGLFLFGLGPLIALVLYWNMIHYTAKDLKKIIARRSAAPEEPFARGT